MERIEIFDHVYDCIFKKEYSDKQTSEYLTEELKISDVLSVGKFIHLLRQLEIASSNAYKEILWGILIQIPGVIFLFGNFDHSSSGLGLCCIGVLLLIRGIIDKLKIIKKIKFLRISVLENKLDTSVSQVSNRKKYLYLLLFILLILGIVRFFQLGGADIFNRYRSIDIDYETCEEPVESINK